MVKSHYWANGMNKLYPLQAGAPMFTIVPMAPVAPTMETDGATHGPITRTPPPQQQQVQVQMQPQQQQQIQQQQQQQQQQVRVQQQVNPLSNTTHGSVQIQLPRCSSTPTKKWTCDAIHGCPTSVYCVWVPK
eukprot:COSAG06_NODE_8093_length_2275_cov_1.080882_3_plen_132_part_00